MNYIIDNSKTKEELFEFVMWVFEQGNNLPREYDNYKIDILFNQNIYLGHESIETYYKFDMFYNVIKTLGIDNIKYIAITTDEVLNEETNQFNHYVYTNNPNVTQNSWDLFYKNSDNECLDYFENIFVTDDTVWLNFVDEEDFDVRNYV